jgi:hypothetical protein
MQGGGVGVKIPEPASSFSTQRNRISRGFERSPGSVFSLQNESCHLRRRRFDPLAPSVVLEFSPGFRAHRVEDAAANSLECVFI